LVSHAFLLLKILGSFGERFEERLPDDSVLMPATVHSQKDARFSVEKLYRAGDTCARIGKQEEPIGG
jgi:hypothetical protein